MQRVAKIKAKPMKREGDLSMATNRKIEELAAVLESSLGASFNPQGYALYRELILLLAEGQPVSPERAASVLGPAREETLELLHQRPSTEWDGAGNIVGAGLTLRPTPHRFKLRDCTLYTWCALDSLMFPGLVGQTVHVESPCASTDRPVRVTVMPEGMKHLEPPDAVVSLVAPEASPDVRRVFCDYVNFFYSAEAATGWLAEHPGATTLPVAEAYQLGRRLTESVFRHWAGPGHRAAD
jgi:alkylmercury lyase